MVFVFAVVVLGYVSWPQGEGQAPWGQAVGPGGRLLETEQEGSLGRISICI
jgi:hypothetical protein